MDVEINENEAKKSETEKDGGFKKPVLLIGKLGRCPRKLITPTNTPKKEEEQIETTIAQDANTDLPEEKKQVPDDSDKEEKLTEGINYKEPEWGGLPTTCSKNYSLEVLKSGSIIEVIDLMSKSYWIFGRMKNCDIAMQHPTISRYHAVLQYKVKSASNEEPGFYIYDMESTHGTFLNKKRLRPQSYVRVKVGHMIKFGCSTRSYILTGPDEDTEEESELTVTELQRKKLESALQAEEVLRQKEKKEDEGIDWGMGDDADEETDLSENPYAQTNNEELYIEDPKKALRGFMEREGLELEYDCTEQRMGEFLCKVMLPLDDHLGRPIYAEVLHKGKKKEAVVQCALEACKILDRYGVLRQATHESRKRKSKDWEANDYYDSDEDTFLDRTGTIERKRANRMKVKNPQQVETYHSLSEKESELKKKIADIEKQLQKTKKESADVSTVSEEDTLDSYMKSLKEPQLEKQTISKLKSDLSRLKQDYAQVCKLLNLAKPTELPALLPQNSSQQSESDSKKKLLPVFGKKRKIKFEKSTKNDGIQSKHNDNNEEEEEDDNETKPVSKIEETNCETDANIIKAEESKTIVKTTDEVKEVNFEKADTSKKRQNEQKSRNERKQTEKVKKIVSKEYPKDGYSEDYNMWVPPTDQSGDGRTSLNDKLGY